MGRFSLRVSSEDDYKKFLELLMHEDIGKFLLKDMSNIQEDSYKKLMRDDVVAYLFKDEDTYIGIAFARLYPSIKKAVLDIGAKKEHRGIKVKKSAEESMKEFREEFKDYDLFSFVKKENRPSLVFSQRIGLKIFNRLNGNYILRYKDER